MADGTLFLAKEDHVDFYNNILTLKVKSKVELKVLDLTGRERVVESVVAVGRSFCEYSFLDYVGEMDQEYPSFGCDELLRSSCYASQYCFEAFGFSVLDVKQAHFQTCERLGLSHRESHVLVKEVFEGSLAHKNKVRSHDLIVSLNGTRIRSAHQHSELLSQGVTDSADSSQPFVVSIDTFGRSEEVSFVAEYLSVDDLRFYDCWPQVEGNEWCQDKFGSQKNPSFCWPPSPEETC